MSNKTARDVIKSALRQILKQADGVEPSAHEMADGLERLNDLLASLTVESIPISHVQLELDDAVNIDKAHQRTLSAMLAVEMAPEFGAAVDPQVAYTAIEGKKLWQADLTRAPDVVFDRTLRRVSKPARYHKW